MRNLILFMLGLTLIYSSKIEAQNQTDQPFSSPKLVVGIVVDQMRYDYLTRFWDQYGQDGFKRMIKDGYNLKNNHYNYVPTYTAPGHTSIYTGTSPRYHGIIANNWYDRYVDQYIYCADDQKVQPVGTRAEAGKMSPVQLLASTVTDQNRIATQFKGKTIGVALKDRASIMPAGHSANAAYWFYGKDEGHFITSSYYMDELPQWVKSFNQSGKADAYLNQKWEPLYPLSTYTQSGPDKTDYEGGLRGQTTFPYDLKKISQKENDKGEAYGYDLIFNVPFGNSLTTDFALAAIDGEALGQDEITDFLTISYSSTDYVGHNFGVNSKEVHDTYLRLDKDIARLLKGLDEKVGKGSYTVFLTADHAAVQVPAYLRSQKMEAGYVNPKTLNADIKAFVQQKYQEEGLLSSHSNRQIFFNYKKLDSLDINRREMANALKDYLTTYPKIAQVYTREMIESGGFSGLIAGRIKNGFNPKRSGDVVYEFEPAYYASSSRTGTTHGSAYKYDTHIPLIFYGKGIHKGETTQASEIVDIAPTLSALLGIAFPNATTGKVLYQVID